MASLELALKQAQQQATYPDQAALDSVVAELSRLPPLVVSWEIEALKEQIASAQRGERFLLQGGDCAETFEDCESDKIAKKLKILLQMSLVLVYGLKKPVIRVGRMAGQYAKPRSADTETRDGVTLPSYRGANVNKPGFTAEERIARPAAAAARLRALGVDVELRALADRWRASPICITPNTGTWTSCVIRPRRMRTRKSCSPFPNRSTSSKRPRASRFTKARRRGSTRVMKRCILLLEQAQTRYIPRSQRWYNLSTHLPWIGMRTAALDGAHVEFFRGISNPLGIKVGPSMSAEWVQGLLATLNPNNEPGRIVLIHRMGAKDIDKRLPPLIQAVRATGSPVLWICDPMHGNTETATSGLKTRRFENILSELESAFRIHRELGSWLGGVHFELTGEDVTECTGGARGLTDADLARAYKSQVDPRLNYEQALELAMRIAGLHSKKGAQKSAVINI